MGSTHRVPGREHIPNYPKGFIVLRILQLIVTVLVLGLTAYTMTVIHFVSNILMLFTTLVSLIVTVWLVSAHSCAPQAYNYWATLVFDIFLFIFWAISFILLALAAAWLLVTDGTYCTYYNDCYSYYVSDTEIAFASTLAAAAGFGAINTLFFFISLIIHSVVVCRHRRNGLHSKIVRGGGHAPLQMTPQFNSTYAAVPQQGVPFNQHVTAYNPGQMYNAPAPQQQGYQSPQQQGFQSPQQQGFQSPQNTGSPPPVANGFYAPPGSFYSGPAPPSTGSPVHMQPTGDQFAKGGSPQVIHSNVHEVPDQNVYQPQPYNPPAYNTHYQNQ